MAKVETSRAYDKFTSLVNTVLSVPKAQVERIVAETPAPTSGHRESQVVHPAQETPSKL